MAISEDRAQSRLPDLKSLTMKPARIAHFLTAAVVAVCQTLVLGSGIIALVGGALIAKAELSPEAHPPVGQQPRRPANYAPFKYPHGPADLLRSDTLRVTAFADQSWADIKRVNASGIYQPAWDSLVRHPCPEWFQDAKLGLFIDWGPWSVAGYGTWQKNPTDAVYPDWYESWMLGPLKDYHDATWGKDFTGDDLIDLLRADHFDPAAFAQLAQDCGMKYVVPFLKHHGGFCLWQSSVTHRNSMEIGMKRDFATELAQACQSKGLKFGIYTSVGEWNYPVVKDGKLLDVGFNGRVTGPLQNDAPFMMGKVPVGDYARDYLVPQIKELIDKTNPDLIWYDGEWEAPAETWRTPELNAYYYNRAAARGQQVAINDRSGKGCRSIKGRADFMTSEYHSITPTNGMIWEECRSISRSFGYNWKEVNDESTVLSEQATIAMFVNIVARGGNLLLIVSPDGCGRIPPNQEKRMRALGAWLKVNGEAIYATRPLPLAKARNVSFTRSKDGRYAYAICTQWPGQSLRLDGVQAAAQAEVTLLGCADALTWHQDDQGLEVTLPQRLQAEANRPGAHAWTIRIPIR